MKKLQKFTFYVIAVVLLTVFVLYAFRYHPEVQFIFFIPGVFIIIYSAFLNDFPNRTRLARNSR